MKIPNMTREEEHMVNSMTFGKLHESVNKNNENEIDQLVFGRKVDLITTLFGCWHNNISRPFINGKVAYRTCLQCGARKRFNPQTLQTGGNFYFPPVAKDIRR